MTVVVTGSAGFIGSALVAHLLEQGHGVVGVDRVAQEPQPGLVVLTADLLARDELVDAAFATADGVVHLAGRPGVRENVPGIERYREQDNVAATARVLAAVPLAVPLVVASSSSVYGGTRGASRETDPLHPRGGYAQSKVRAEQLCARRLRSGGIVAVARPFTVIGERQRRDMAVSRWLEAALAGRPLRVFGSLERRRDLTDVRDVGRVLAGLVQHGVCGPVNVGTGRSYRLREVVEAVEAACGVCAPVDIVPASGDEAEATRADTTRLRNLLGFVPATDLHEVVARQLAARRVEAVA